MTAFKPYDPYPPLAVLIDAENISARHAKAVMERTVERFGSPIIRRAYGDWTTSQLNPWKRCVEDLAIRPVQQFRHANGKSSADATLIMDAMELLYTTKVGGFCIVSSDCDFTALAGRLRERGRVVYGFGTQNAMRAFAAACDEFVFVDATQEAPEQK